jgi:fumarylacetoacetase
MHPNDPSLRSFIEVDPQSHFPIQNLPFGIFSTPGSSPRAGVAIGDMVVDLASLEEAGLLGLPGRGVLARPVLNDFIALGRETSSAVRTRVSELLRHDNHTLRDDAALRARVLHPMAASTMHMPVAVGGFSDFMLSREHSLNCLDILGGGAAGGLWPNWTYLPMAYNGRASSIVVSGTPVKRPRGQVRNEGQAAPVYQPTAKLDFELEAAIVVGRGNELGSTVGIADADAHMFGVVLLNDWSTRDVQAWEAQPLGVFVSKGHRTSISPWIVTFDALEPFRTEGPQQIPPPLAYLDQKGPRNFNVHMQASIRPQDHARGSVVCRSNLQTLYWSFAQQVAHHTSTGCNLMPGDLLATGTVSASGPNAMGCLYEATRDGRQAIALEQGGTRLYLEDGDEVVLTAWAQGQGYRIGFGECTGRITPADSNRDGACA